MIFRNPAGAPELACEHCGCRWFDRISGACYECGTTVPAEAIAEYERALAEFAARAQTPAAGAPTAGDLNRKSCTGPAVSGRDQQHPRLYVGEAY